MGKTQKGGGRLGPGEDSQARQQQESSGTNLEAGWNCTSPPEPVGKRGKAEQPERAGGGGRQQAFTHPCSAHLVERPHSLPVTSQFGSTGRAFGATL